MTAARIIIIVALLLNFAWSSRANVVLQFNDLMIDAARTDVIGPDLCSRNLAILHTSIHRAANSAPDDSLEFTIASAACEVISNLHPSKSLAAQKLLAQNSTASKASTIGREIARTILAARENDGSSADSPYIPNSAPGQWQRTPPHFRPPASPQWRHVKLFALPEKEKFLPPPPPALDSPEYAAAVREVESLGAKNSSTRTVEQTLTARFWSDFSYTATPPGHWHQIAATICRARQTNLRDTARLFALLSVAQADAAIVCWEAKYRYNFWRPITAIHNADRDANPATTAKKSWEALLPAPPFPAYVSGHSIFSHTSAEILRRIFGTDNITFEVASDTLPNVTRTFTSLTACANEVGMSRIYGGIHFAFDNEQGKLCAQKIAAEIMAQHGANSIESPL